MRKVIIDIYNKRVEIRDEIVDIFEKACGKINNTVIEYLMFMDGAEGNKMSDIELIDQIEASLLTEVRMREFLSRPENTKRAIEFATSN